MTATSAAERGANPLDPDELRRIDAYWRAANYLSVGQIYLLDNPLLREPLRPEHVKPRLLGHWGTTPGPELRLRPPEPRDPARDLDAIYVIGPGHGGPALVANAYLEGTYTEVYPTSAATRRACAGCSGSSRSPAASRATSRRRRPGSIHEGGELGYALVARLRRRVRQPRPARLLRRRRRRGRDRAAGDQLALEQVPRPGARRRRPADPPPQRLQDRQPDRPRPHPATTSSTSLLEGYGYAPYFVEGDDPAAMHQQMAATLDEVARRDRARSSARAREGGVTERPRWPMIVLRTPKGWTGPEGGRRAAGRGHVALAPGAAGRGPDERRAPGAARGRGCAATGPRSCSTTTGALGAELAALAPARRRGG